jgi:hypothetical protein
MLGAFKSYCTRQVKLFEQNFRWKNRAVQ